jgi:glutathione S-transferase
MNMIVLRTAKFSPFGRKCWMAAIRLELMGRIQVVEANYMNADDPLHGENPLGKMPVLTTESGEHVYDSPVIIEYLDHLAGGGRLLPREWPQRLENLTMQALADGVADAGALIAMEGRMRPREMWSSVVIEYQRGKIARGLADAATRLPDPSAVQVGALSLAATLGYIDRRGSYQWRTALPKLVAWLDEFRAHAPEFDLTHVPPEPGYVSP